MTGAWVTQRRLYFLCPAGPLPSHCLTDSELRECAAQALSNWGEVFQFVLLFSPFFTHNSFLQPLVALGIKRTFKCQCPVRVWCQRSATSVKYKNLIVNSCLSLTLTCVFPGDRMLLPPCKELFLTVSLLVYWFKTD